MRVDGQVQRLAESAVGVLLTRAVVGRRRILVRDPHLVHRMLKAKDEWAQVWHNVVVVCDVRESDVLARVGDELIKQACKRRVANARQAKDDHLEWQRGAEIIAQRDHRQSRKRRTKGMSADVDALRFGMSGKSSLSCSQDRIVRPAPSRLKAQVYQGGANGSCVCNSIRQLTQRTGVLWVIRLGDCSEFIANR